VQQIGFGFPACGTQRRQRIVGLRDEVSPLDKAGRRQRRAARLSGSLWNQRD
jgi:hypothetical protein